MIATAITGVDRWMWWPTACTAAMIALFIFVGEMPGPLSIFLPALAIVSCPPVALLLIGSAFALGLRRQPCKAVSMLLALAIPAVLLRPIAMVEPYVHLGLTLGFDIGYLDAAPSTEGSATIYDWSTGLAGGPNTFLIHDRTDMIARPVTKDDASSWKATDLLMAYAGRTQHLVGHYHVCIL